MTSPEQAGFEFVSYQERNATKNSARTRYGAVWIAVVALLGMLAATARSEVFGVIGDDNRVPVDVSMPPYHAVGQINIAGWRLRWNCTGTLIAPRIVVTAAHCLVTPWDMKPVPAHDIHFRAGVNKDMSTGHSVAACVKFSPGALSTKWRYNPNIVTQSAPFEFFLNDIAVIVLKDDIPVSPVGPALSGSFKSWTPLIHAGYPANRRHQLMADQRCIVLAHRRGLWLTNCDTYLASSGGPLFVEQDGEWRVGAVMVSEISSLEDTVGTAAWPLSGWKDLPLTPDCPKH